MNIEALKKLDRFSQNKRGEILNCRGAQKVCSKWLRELIYKGIRKDFGFKEWASIAHLVRCKNPECVSLNSLAHMDKYLEPHQMLARYSERIRRWCGYPPK